MWFREANVFILIVACFMNERTDNVPAFTKPQCRIASVRSPSACGGEAGAEDENTQSHDAEYRGCEGQIRRIQKDVCYTVSMGFFDAMGLTKKITRGRLDAFLKKYATEKKTLDIGWGTALYGKYFPNRTTLDIEARPNTQVDIIADAHDLSEITDASYEVILCTEVLEHLHTPAKALAEFHRVLKAGGLLLLSTRFVFPLHDVPGDYYRYTKYGLRHLLQDFEIEDIVDEATTMETLAVLYQRIGFQCDTLWLRPCKSLWFLKALLVRVCLGWVVTAEYGDIHHREKEKNILCSGYYVAARKPTNSIT